LEYACLLESVTYSLRVDQCLGYGAGKSGYGAGNRWTLLGSGRVTHTLFGQPNASVTVRESPVTVRETVGLGLAKAA
jgi:hypothetical protein